MDITFITGNPAKAEQVSRMLSYPIKYKSLDLAEIQSLDIEEIAQVKAKAAFELMQSPVLVDDVSVFYHVMGRLPGPFVKWFLKETGNEGLCRLLDGYADRGATAIAIFILYDGKTMKTFRGEVIGKIANHPSGTTKFGFGWDTAFIPDGYSVTRGEMSIEEYDATSPRAKALKKLEEYLRYL